MPYPIQHLLEGRSRPTTVTLTDSVTTAIVTMTEKGYSQLPVVEHNNQPVGMITYESIIQAVSNFTVGVDGLQVTHALIKADMFALDDDLFDILDRLQEKNAILVVDADKELIGIVTNYDSTAYFRRRAEDLMLIEDIESMIKDLIQTAFQMTANNDTTPLLDQAIARLTGSQSEIRSQHINALRAYLGRIGQQALGASIDETLFDASFQRVLPNRKPKKFEQLSLGEFIDLLLHEHAWQQLAPQMQLDRNAVRHLLNNIRETRNQLAHFRGEISPAQRSQLRFCWNWLQQYQLIVTDTTAQPDGFGADVAKASLSGSESEIAYSSVDMGSRGYEDESDDQVSRYSPLSTYLQNEGAEQENIKLTFAKIEQIIGQELPASARVHRSWWANDSQGHVQAQSWLEIGWRVSSVNLSAQVVTFSPVKERQKLYIDFFSALLQDLRQLPDFPLRDAASPGGASWFKLSRLAPSGTDQVVMIVVAFARQSQCRVELYIHSGDRQDKWVFDQLHGQKEAIEAAVGEALSWQRLDTKQASRIALYHPGRITDPPAKLAELREWAVAAIVRLSTALLAQAEEAVSELAQPVL